MPRHQTIAAYAALFIALGGTATAAVHLGRGSVGSREIRNHSVHAIDLATKPLTGARLRSIVEDVVTDPTTGLTIKVQGEKGDPGAAGPQGPTGPQGAPGIGQVVTVQADGPDVSSGYSTAEADCPSGTQVLGGGAHFQASGDAGAVLTSSAPVSDGSGWTAEMHSVGPTVGHVHAYALCARVGS